MNRRSRTLLLLGAAIVLLAAVAAAVAWRPWAPSAVLGTRAAEQAVGGSAFIPILNLNVDTIQSVELESAAGTIELDDRGGVWRIVKPAVLSVRKAALEDLLYTLTTLSSERVVADHPASLTPYGLQPPAVTARVHLTSGEVREICLGDRTPAGDSYYLMAKGDGRVFTVREHHGTFLHYGIRDLWEGSRTPIDSSYVVSLMIARDGRTVVQIGRTEDLYRRDVEFRGTTLSVIYPWASAPKPVDLYFLTDFVNSLGSLKPDEAIDANPQSKARYGLDSPSWELLVQDGNGARLHLFVGKREGRALYLQFERDPTVYAGDPKLLDLLRVTPYQFASKYAAIVKLDTVDSFTISASGAGSAPRTRHVLEVRRATPGSEDGAQWLVDGRPVAVKAFKDFYTRAISLQIDGFHQDVIRGAPEVTMSFALNTAAHRTFTVSFVPYSQEFYAEVKDGRSDILVNRQQLRVLLQELDRLVAASGG